MHALKTTGKIFYGLGMTGIGILNFVFPGFRGVILPIPPESTEHINFLVYLTGAIIALASLYIAFGKNVKTVSLLMGLLLGVFIIAGQVPIRLAGHYYKELGNWTNTLKLLSLTGGAFIIGGLYPGGADNRLLRFLGKITPYGKYFFAVMLIAFGIDHFIYVGFVKSLVPHWIGAELFWTYFTGVALFCSGLAIFLNYKPHLISLLLAGMLFIWFIVLHIPGALHASDRLKEPNWIGVFQCWAFSGIALLYPYSKALTRKDRKI